MEAIKHQRGDGRKVRRCGMHSARLRAVGNARKEPKSHFGPSRRKLTSAVMSEVGGEAEMFRTRLIRPVEPKETLAPRGFGQLARLTGRFGGRNPRRERRQLPALDC